MPVCARPSSSLVARSPSFAFFATAVGETERKKYPSLKDSLPSSVLESQKPHNRTTAKIILLGQMLVDPNVLHFVPSSFASRRSLSANCSASSQSRGNAYYISPSA
ncbi:hypothetical protein BofuT4_P032560.1 [Botrytis cinerea T4]|uniref:Uncharacterized protein n=1 Tax=Botryotinia fuckeliana (strain T4) TaxID=999810 RepID=G2Y8B8_BOTF4|nr:hypothetical protein BofuT4_P032560.1 [Botrytis cinerea T4]